LTNAAVNVRALAAAAMVVVMVAGLVLISHH